MPQAAIQPVIKVANIRCGVFSSAAAVINIMPRLIPIATIHITIAVM
jgi:hypothetical protein